MSKEKTYYYFIGIGGIGMSALARYFHHFGNVVLGYDKTKTELTKTLENEGIQIHYTDNPKQIPVELNPENTQVIYTPAVPKNHQELDYFGLNGFDVKKRSEILGEITKNTFNISVAGTHGKTTTSAIIGHLLKETNQPSTAFLGGIAQNYNSNLVMNGNEISVTEADEYDRSFLRLSPNFAVITSIDADHLDIYGNHNDLKETFAEFGAKASEKLFVRKGIPIQGTYTYAANEKADFYAENIRIENANYVFDLVHPKGKIENFELILPGLHNLENTVVALAIALNLEIPEAELKSALKNFHGVKRRFNRYNIENKVYIDDYAHHPTEINAVVQAVRALYPTKKIMGIFQPHLFSRTQDFADGFAESLFKFDELLLLDIYPAREEPIAGVTSDWLADKIDKPVQVCALADAISNLKNYDFDVLVTIGAGDIDTLVEPIKTMLS